jgi:hypothetical protein
MNKYYWDTEQLLKLRPGTRVTRRELHDEADQGIEHVVLKAPIEDPDWTGGWRVYLEVDDACFTSSIDALDPDTMVQEPEIKGADLIRHAHSLRAEREVLLGRLRSEKREILNSIVQDLESQADRDELLEKYEEWRDF